MNIVSVNVGLPREVVWQGQTVTTGIFKSPVTGRVRVQGENLAGDRQADLTVHGGPDKAVYAYPSEHYEYWRRELPGMDLTWGAFGENLTTAGLSEETTFLGDRFRMGSAELRVTQPRLPCRKLGIRFRSDDMIRRFVESGRTGFYLSIREAGEVGAGDPIEKVAHGSDDLSITELVRIHTSDREDLALLLRVAAAPDLSEKWRKHFRERIQSLEARSAKANPGEV